MSMSQVSAQLYVKSIHATVVIVILSAFGPLYLQVLQPQQQRAVLRPQVTLPTTPIVTLRNQAPGRIIVGQQQVQLKELQPGEVVNVISPLSGHVCVYLWVTNGIY